MRRSVREAIVGFTLIAAVAGTGLFWLWLRGVSLASRTWRFQVSFADASGLAERSAVTYRGVLVGNVDKLTTTAAAVVADLEITDPNLKLPQPLVAQKGIVPPVLVVGENQHNVRLGRLRGESRSHGQHGSSQQETGSEPADRETPHGSIIISQHDTESPSDKIVDTPKTPA